KGNSWFETIKSFPENSEIDVRLHFKTSKPVAADAMQNPYSFFHTYHYSLSTLPTTDYVPRLADDRVGHFVTVFQDYSTLDTVTPWVRFVNRWNLKKKFPDSAMSEPVAPIVYWIDNTVPTEYRDAVKEGIEFWNKSYEKIGFRNAVVAKQMPDTADWDPADARYSTVRWMLTGTYAVGPSRTNPFTGQIYDADVRVGADFLRAMFNDVNYELKPLAFDGKLFVEANEFGDGPVNSRNCNYGASSARQAMFGLNALLANSGDLANKDSLTQQYVHEYLVELIAHEVGHTLGFRHNFKASTIYSQTDLDDVNFTRSHGTVGTVMEYAPANIGLPGGGQGNYFSPVPGPYDDWAIEYAYSDFGAKTTSEELPKLQAIASKASQPELAYGTDEDNFGNTSKAIDPNCNLFDQGNDVLGYCERKLALTRNVMKNAMTKAEKPGSSYQEVLRVFSPAMSGYFYSGMYAARQIGGIYHFRDHAGDPGGRLPFKPVPASVQKKALALLKDNIFSANSFDFAPELLNKLQPNRLPDFQWTQYSVAQIDYPIHSTVLGIQNIVFSTLYSGYTLNRLLDNQERIGATDEKFTMYDLFTELRRSIWSELSGGSSINDFRRQLQMLHIQYLTAIYLSAGNIFPTDAKTLAANDLDIIEESSRNAIGAGTLDGMSRAHLNQVIKQIQAAKNARRDFASPLGLK
ncbi:MAG: zinc-dependent metalloprotease, partial [Candidatus Zixiibacteriota bacterium]